MYMKPSEEEALKQIPRGFYCYEGDKICPYWSSRPELPEQENGYCSYLGQSDWDINEENGDMNWVHGDGSPAMTTKPHEIGMSLLWDQVKMCNINEPTDEELEEEHKQWEKRSH